MIKISLVLLVIIVNASCPAQNADKFFSAKEAEKIVRVLSADEMNGRKILTPGIDKAATFIAGEFTAAGLQPWKEAAGYRQEFAMARSQLIRVSGSLDKKTLKENDIVVITSLPELLVMQQSDFQKIQIKAGADLFGEAARYVHAGRNYLVLVDTSFSKNFNRLAGLKRQLFQSDKSVVFVLTNQDPGEFEIRAVHEVTTMKLQNIVGVLPGKSKRDEYVVFSGHYDHIGTGKAVNGDSIYNGANDDATGITAVIMLAKYFKSLGTNERTLVFAAFTAEESGGFGSQYFSGQFDAEKVKAMFNIEMIGTDSKWGKNSAYITGFEKTDMGKILEKNLTSTGFTFHADPYPEQELFYRSDNATLARLGVPAHTISTSKMDSEKFYHTVDDEIETLDLTNMAGIIKAIALSSTSIINGKDTPSRVDTKLLR